MEKDIVIIGSGGAGLAAAVTAAKAGLDVLVVEKTQYFGGTTALSGGGIWNPGNHLAAEAGMKDSPEDGFRYIEGLVGDRLRRDVLATFTENAPRMLRFMHDNTDVRFSLHPDQPDYYKEYEGAKLDGRVLDPVDFDGRQMDRDDLLAIRPPLKEFNAPMGFMIGFPDIPHLMNAKKSLKSLAHVMKLFGRYAMDRISYPRGTHLTMGNALIARLLLTARKAGVTLWRNAPMTRLIIENGRVTGVEINHNGKLETVSVRRGAVLASGGFSQNEELRKQYIPYPEHHVSFLPEGNTGDGIKAGLAAGGELEVGNYANAAWAVLSVLKEPNGNVRKQPHVMMDRTKPGCIAVNNAGQRFVNECAANFVEKMHESGSVPAHLLCDHRFIKKYGLGLVMPGGMGLKKMIEAGYIITAPTIAELAVKIGVNAGGLAETVAKHNEYARAGKDPDFGKGDTEADTCWGDLDHKPNPCLGPIDTGPFYAVKIFPGDGSTTLGLKVSATAQVLDAGGTPIQGLYACGLDMNVLWRGREPSHGSYNGLGLTFGYVVGQQLANNAQ